MTQFSVLLFVSGDDDRRSGYIGTVMRACDRHLARRYRLTVVDARREPELVAREGVIATPTLVVNDGGRSRRFVGDLGHHRLSELLQHTTHD